MHGETVAAGLVIESYISMQLGYLSTPEYREIEQTIISIFGKLNMQGYDVNDPNRRMRQDKKNMQHKISFSLIREIGHATFDDNCDMTIVQEAVKYYSQL